MNGYQITFFTQQGRMHHEVPLAQWLLAEARQMGLRGATLSGALQGLGHDGQFHALTMFDESDQPIQVTMVVNEEERHRWLERLELENMELFFTSVPVEFGVIGQSPQ